MMRFAAVPAAILREDPCLSATPADLGAWLRLLVYASEIEREVIPLHSDNERGWMVACGVTGAEVAGVVLAHLGKWCPGGLWIHGYDHEGQAKVEGCRRAAKKGGQASAQARAQADASPSAQPLSSPLLSLPFPSGSGSCAEPDKPATAPTAKEPAGVGPFPVIGAPDFWIPPAKVAEWVSTFTGIVVIRELRLARQWLLDNPTRRKTPRGMTRFLFAWLAREQNRAPRVAASLPPRPASRYPTAEETAAFLGGPLCKP